MKGNFIEQENLLTPQFHSRKTMEISNIYFQKNNKTMNKEIIVQVSLHL